MNSSHKGPVTRKMFPFDGVNMMRRVGIHSIQWCNIINHASPWLFDRIGGGGGGGGGGGVCAYLLLLITPFQHHYSCSHDDVIKWKHFPRYWPFVLLVSGEFPFVLLISGEFPTQRPVTRSFDIFFDLHLIKRLSKHSRGWWFETLSRPLWRHRNDMCTCICGLGYQKQVSREDTPQIP